MADYGNALRLAIKQVRDLRACYNFAFREIEPADECVRQLCAALLSPELELALKPLSLHGVIKAAPRRVGQITHVERQREADLAMLFGYTPRDVRKYINSCSAVEDWSPPRIASALELAEFVRSRHAELRTRFQSTGRSIQQWRRRQKIARTADRFVFSVGLLLADGLRRSDIPVSYGLFCILLVADADE